MGGGARLASLLCCKDGHSVGNKVSLGQHKFRFHYVISSFFKRGQESRHFGNSEGEMILQFTYSRNVQFLECVFIQTSKSSARYIFILILD